MDRGTYPIARLMERLDELAGEASRRTPAAAAPGDLSCGDHDFTLR
jgi:hypothetical protein